MSPEGAVPGSTAAARDEVYGVGEKGSPSMKNIAPEMRMLEKKFPIRDWKAAMRDRRRRSRISAGTVAQLVVEMVPRAQTSLLEVDQDARLSEVLAWHESEREMVASDTTIVRSLAGFALEPVREALWQTARAMRERPGMRVKLPSGRKVRLGIADGSEWGHFTGSVLALSGKRATVVAGYAMGKGRGHELATTRKLLAEGVRRLGRGFVDLLVVDGLYVTERDFRWGVEEGGCALVVKTSEESLTVIADARELFFGNPAEMEGSLEHVRGTDAERGIEYEIIAAAGFRWNDLPHPVKIAWVRERFLKPKPGHPAETTFWVITTDQTLSAEDLREVAHSRWRIENGIFRRLSGLVDSKRRLTADAHVREALMGLWFLGLNLMGIVLAWTGLERRHPAFPTVKATWKWIARLWVRSTALAAGVTT